MFNTAAMTNTMRQLLSLATQPANVRASRMPSNSPVITVPIAWPRRSRGTRSGAMGSATWVTLAISPIRTLATIIHANPCANAASSSASATPAYIRIISARRSATSPRGTNNRMPQA